MNAPPTVHLCPGNVLDRGIVDCINANTLLSLLPSLPLSRRRARAHACGAYAARVRMCMCTRECVCPRACMKEGGSNEIPDRNVPVCARVCMCACVCVRVCARARNKETQISVCVCARQGWRAARALADVKKILKSNTKY